MNQLPAAMGLNHDTPQVPTAPTEALVAVCPGRVWSVAAAAHGPAPVVSEGRRWSGCQWTSGLVGMVDDG